MQEVWRPVVGYEGLYEVSDTGQVRAPAKWTRGKADSHYLRPPRPIRQSKHRYWSVCLYRGGKKRTALVHLLVLEAFVGPRPSDKHVACHGEKGVDDNSVLNLRWDTQQANLADRHRDGTMTQGSAHGRAVLSEEQVRLIRRRVSQGEAQARVAKDFGVSASLVWRVVHNLLWTHV